MFLVSHFRDEESQSILSQWPVSVSEPTFARFYLTRGVSLPVIVPEAIGVNFWEPVLFPNGQIPNSILFPGSRC